MSTALCHPHRRDESQPLTSETVQERIAEVNAEWSQPERLRRALEGQSRCQQLLAILGLDVHQASA